MVDPRLSNALGDVALTVQLSAYFVFWMQRRPKRDSLAYVAAYYLYALNLLLAVMFTASGAVLHVVDPLPQRPTALWLTFLMTCVSTPVFFPVICTCALYPKMSRAAAGFCFAWPAVTYSTHAWLALTSADLSRWFQPPPAVSILGRALDGRSLAGQSLGIDFDLLTSVPCMRGDGIFVHASMFTAAACGTLAMCVFALSEARGGVRTDAWIANARMLTLSIALLVLGQLLMIPGLAIVGVARTLDLWHVSICLVMAFAFNALRGLVLQPAKVAKA